MGSDRVEAAHTTQIATVEDTPDDSCSARAAIPGHGQRHRRDEGLVGALTDGNENKGFVKSVRNCIPPSNSA